MDELTLRPRREEHARLDFEKAHDPRIAALLAPRLGHGGGGGGEVPYRPAARFGLRRAGAFTFLDNPGSVRVLEKNGFALAGRFDGDTRSSGYYHKT